MITVALLPHIMPLLTATSPLSSLKGARIIQWSTGGNNILRSGQVPPNTRATSNRRRQHCLPECCGWLYKISNINIKYPLPSLPPLPPLHPSSSLFPIFYREGGDGASGAFSGVIFAKLADNEGDEVEAGLGLTSESIWEL